MADPSTFQSLSATGQDHQELRFTHFNGDYNFYAFNASYNDQPNITIKIEVKFLFDDSSDNRFTTFPIERGPHESGYAILKKYHYDTDQVELVNYVAEMYGRIPKIFRECVKEIWIIQGTENA